MKTIKQTFKWFSKKPYTKAQYINAFATVIGIIVSCLAIAIAISANQLAQKAINSNRELFFREMKPYIVLDLEHVSDTGTFYSFTLLPDGESIIITLQYAIRNIGRSGADSIVFSLESTPYYEVDKSINDVLKPVTLPSLQDLGPGERRKARFEITLQTASPKVYKHLVAKLSNGLGFEIRSVVSITYTNEIAPDMRFRSTASHSFWRNRARITNTQYEQLD